MMIEFPRLQMIRRTKHALIAGMLVLALLTLYQALLTTTSNLEKLDTWPRQPATVISLADEVTIEVEVADAFANSLPHKQMPEYCTAYEIGHTCLLLPRSPYAWLSLFDDVEILQNPKQPNELEILSQTGFWLPMLGHVVTVLLLAGASYGLKKSAWGEDRTWFNGRWIPSEQAPQRVGFSGVDTEWVRESRPSRKGVIFWSILFIVIAAFALPDALINLSTDPFQAVPVIVVIVGLLLLVLYSSLATFTRAIYQDRNGLLDTNFFGVKRLPWDEVGNVELVNLNKEAQARHRRSPFGSGRSPETINVYVISDTQGRKILQLSQQMIPSNAFRTLLARLQAQVKTDKRSPSVTPAGFEQEWQRMAERLSAQPKSLFHPDHRGLLITLTLMLLPFVLGTTYMVYQNLWFIYGAEQTQGRIVEIKNEGLPSLVVEYKTPLGETLRLQSDGSESYASYHPGDALTVYYEADHPENACLDLFLELWLGTMIMAGITSVVVLLAVLIAKAMTKPMPGMG